MKPVVTVVVENLHEALAARSGWHDPAAVRRAEVAAVVDPDRVCTALPADLITALGLVPAWGGRFSAVRLAIDGQTTSTDVEVLPAGSQAVIGRATVLALEGVAHL